MMLKPVIVSALSLSPSRVGCVFLSKVGKAMSRGGGTLRGRERGLVPVLSSIIPRPQSYVMPLKICQIDKPARNPVIGEKSWQNVHGKFKPNNFIILHLLQWDNKLVSCVHRKRIYMRNSFSKNLKFRPPDSKMSQIFDLNLPKQIFYRLFLESFVFPMLTLDTVYSETSATDAQFDSSSSILDLFPSRCVCVCVCVCFK